MTDRPPPGSTAGSGHADLHEELAVGWVLHTLEPEDETEFVLHLVDCPLCSRAVAETEETLGLLGAAILPVDPPPGLRRRLMDAVADEGGVAPAPAVESASEPAPTHPTEPAPAADVIPLAPRRRRASRFAMAAAAALVVVAVGGLAVVNQQVRSERDAEAAAAARTSPVVEVLRDAGTPGVAHASLTGTDGAMVGLVVDTGTGPRVLSTGLDANATDHTYVLWGLAGEQPTALGTFDVSGQSPTVLDVPSTTQADPYEGFAVSLEPGRTAPASPTLVVASGQVGR